MYCTIEDVGKYIEQFHLPNDPERLLWDSLDDISKNVYLNRSFLYIEGLPYIGKKRHKDQVEAFPRCPDDEVTQEVIYAQASYTLYLVVQNNSASVSAEEIRDNIAAGIKSFSLGSFSESYSDVVSSVFVPTTTKRYLSRWLDGGYNVHGTHSKIPRSRLYD